MNVFLDMLPDDLPSIFPKKEIDFGIDLFIDTQLISISSYHMVLMKHKELKD